MRSLQGNRHHIGVLEVIEDALHHQRHADVLRHQSDDAFDAQAGIENPRLKSGAAASLHGQFVDDGAFVEHDEILVGELGQRDRTAPRVAMLLRDDDLKPIGGDFQTGVLFSIEVVVTHKGQIILVTIERGQDSRGFALFQT